MREHCAALGTGQEGGSVQLITVVGAPGYALGKFIIMFVPAGMKNVLLTLPEMVILKVYVVIS